MFEIADLDHQGALLWGPFLKGVRGKVLPDPKLRWHRLY
jgi:hypothetical protein